MTDQGWVKVHRKLLDWPWFKYPATAHLWQYCLLRANHKAATVAAAGQEVHLEPGQFIFGRAKAAADTGLSPKQVRTALAHLLSAKCVFRANHPAKQFSILTVAKWEAYQSVTIDRGQRPGQAGANQGPTKGQPRATDKTLKTAENQPNDLNNLVPSAQEEPPSSNPAGGNGDGHKAIDYPPGFLRFWQAYPNKQGKAKAAYYWKRDKLEGRADEIIEIVHGYEQTHEWKRNGGQFVPHGSTWLSERRWEDDPSAIPKARAGPSWANPDEHEATAEEHAKGF